LALFLKNLAFLADEEGVTKPKMIIEGLPISWPFFISSLISCELAILAWTRKKSAYSNYFILAMVLAGLWSLIAGLHIQVSDYETKLFLSDLKYVFIAALPVAWLLLASSFTGKGLSLKVEGLLFIVPALTVGLIATNPLHGFVFLKSEALIVDNFISISRDYGFWFWVHTYYSYTLIGVGTLMFIRFVFRSKGDLRSQAIIMAAGSLIPFALNAVFLWNPELSFHLDFTPVSFALSGIVLFVGLFKYRLLSVMPIARDEIIKSMVDGVIITDTDGRIVDVNDAAAHLKHDLSEPAIDQDIATIFPHLSDMWKEARDQELFAGEFCSEDGSGERWINVLFKMVRNSIDEYQGHLVLLRDVTEQKRAEVKISETMERAEELSKLKSAFLSNMSHDVRTPLSGIIGLADVLIEECTGERKELAELIRSSSDRLLKLLNSILSVAHLSSGSLDQNMERTNINDLSRKIISQFEREIKAKKLDFHVSIPEQAIEGELDPNHLGHAISHLLDQSVRSTESGSIQFDLRKELTDIVIRIADTGHGLEQVTVDAIHQPLDSLSLPEFGMEKSFGLGLRVAHGFIEEIGGQLEIKSILETGSTFTIRLPIRMADRNVETASKDRAPNRGHHNSLPVKNKSIPE